MLTWRGPQFLVLFAGVAVAVYILVGIAIAAREREILPVGRRVRDPYAIAYLRGDIAELVCVVALALTLRGLLRVGATALETVDRSDIDRVNLPIEKALLAACLHASTPAAIAAHPLVEMAADEYRRDLLKRRLLADEDVKRARFGAVRVGITVLASLALAKIAVALVTGHHNIMLLVIGAGVAIIALAMQAAKRRTSAGNAALKDLAALFASLKRRGKQLPPDAVSEATLLAAVFGVYAVSASSAAAWQRVFARRASSDSSSSCGSGGCGGGGGCGGCGS